MPFPSWGEIQRAVAAGRLKRLPVSTLEQYLEVLVVNSAKVDEQTLTQVTEAVRDELRRREGLGRSRANIVGGIIGVVAAFVAALVILKRCH